LTKKKTQAAPGKPVKVFDPHNVNAKTLGDVLGMSQTAVAHLRRGGTFKTNGKQGKYDLFNCVPLYIQSIKTSGVGEASERLKIAQRKKIELQNDVSAGLLVKVATVAALLNESAAGFLGVWRAIPRRISGKLATMSNAKACRELLENESDNARFELSAPIRKFYIDRGEALPDILADTLNGQQKETPKPRAVGRRKQNSTKRKRRTRPVEK